MPCISINLFYFLKLSHFKIILQESEVKEKNITTWLQQQMTFSIHVLD